MPYKTWVVGEEVLASELNQYIQAQVVSTHANAAARTAAIPTPVAGMVSYLIDTSSLEVFIGSSWSAVGSRVLGYAQSIVNSPTVGTTATALPALSVNVTTNAARRIHVELFLPLGSATNNGWAQGTIVDNGTAIQSARVNTVLGATAPSVYASVISTPAAGAHAYTFTSQTNVGTVVWTGATTAVQYARVTDIGPV